MAYHQSPTRESLLAEVREADRQVECGHFIEHEDMKTWLLSWGTEHELPPPKCICGRSHDPSDGGLAEP
jgi:predicted transcriptional regulator